VGNWQLSYLPIEYYIPLFSICKKRADPRTKISTSTPQFHAARSEPMEQHLNIADVRNAIPGWKSPEGFTAIKSTRRNRTSTSDADVIKNLEPLLAVNPLSQQEQISKTKANLSGKSPKQVYYNLVTKSGNRCAKFMLNNVVQCELATDEDIIAVVDHCVSLISSAPDEETRKAFADARADGHIFYDSNGNYDINSISWFCDELFYQGAFHEMVIEDKEAFVKLYMEYGNSMSAEHRTAIFSHLFLLPSR
jgi:hypothetical protein